MLREKDIDIFARLQAYMATLINSQIKEDDEQTYEKILDTFLIVISNKREFLEELSTNNQLY